jgi:hypothetical protein
VTRIPKKLNFAHKITDPIKSHKITERNYSMDRDILNEISARRKPKGSTASSFMLFPGELTFQPLNLFLGPRVSLNIQDALAPQFKALGDQKWESLPCSNSHKTKQSLKSFLFCAAASVMVFNLNWSHLQSDKTIMGEGSKNHTAATSITIVSRQHFQLAKNEPPICARAMAHKFQVSWPQSHSLCRNPLLLEHLQGGISKHGCLHPVLLLKYHQI